MADLNTESPQVIFALQSWIHHLVEAYGIDAIRVDTVKHIRKDFWPGFVQAGGVAAVGEILHGGAPNCPAIQCGLLMTMINHQTPTTCASTSSTAWRASWITLHSSIFGERRLIRVLAADLLSRTFESTSTPIDELTSMITRVHKMLPDPTLLGSFLEYVLPNVVWTSAFLTIQ